VEKIPGSYLGSSKKTDEIILTHDGESKSGEDGWHGGHGIGPWSVFLVFGGLSWWPWICVLGLVSQAALKLGGLLLIPGSLDYAGEGSGQPFFDFLLSS